MTVLTEAKRTQAEVAFDKATRSAFSDWHKNEAEVFKRVDRILKDYQANILGDLSYGGTDWSLARAEEVKKAIADARMMADAQIRNLWRDEANRAAGLAMMKVDGPLAALGLPVDFIHAGVSLPQLAVLQDYVPTLIQGVTLETQQRVTSLIQHAVLGGVDQREIMRQVGRAVGPINTAKRPDHTIFSKTHVRSRMIMRTEMNRLNNLSVMHRAGGISEKYPGVGVKWQHRGSPSPRRSHTSLHEQVIFPAEGEKFILIGSNGTKYKVDGPHDPALPAEHSIGCHCGLRVVYDAERGLKGAKDSPYIAGDGSNIPSAGGVGKKTAGKKKPKNAKKLTKTQKKEALEKIALKKGLAKDVNFKRCGEDMAEIITNVLGNLKKGNVPLFDSIGPLSLKGPKYKGTLYVVEHRYIPQTGELVSRRLLYNPKINASKETADAFVERMKKAGLFGEATIEECIEHEFAHLLDHWNWDLHKNGSNRLSKAMKARWGTSESAAASIEELRKVTGDYMLTNQAELYAEAFRCWRADRLPKSWSWLDGFFKAEPWP